MIKQCLYYIVSDIHTVFKIRDSEKSHLYGQDTRLEMMLNSPEAFQTYIDIYRTISIISDNIMQTFQIAFGVPFSNDSETIDKCKKLLINRDCTEYIEHIEQIINCIQTIKTALEYRAINIELIKYMRENGSNGN